MKRILGLVIIFIFTAAVAKATLPTRERFKVQIPVSRRNTDYHFYLRQIIQARRSFWHLFRGDKSLVASIFPGVQLWPCHEQDLPFCGFGS